jgi:hypothetical protein
VAVDAAGLLYVAMPASPDRDPYGASLLRFAPDGTTPRDNRAFSPIYAAGLDDPAVLAASAAGSTWLASGDASGRALLVATHVPGDMAPNPVLVAPGGTSLFRITASSGPAARVPLDAIASGHVTSAASGSGGRIYAGVAIGTDPAEGFALVVLEPVDPAR